MKRTINSLFCLTLLIAPSYLNAQITQENITHYSELDGNNIFDVMSDQFGTIWITTHNGLLRFDGYEFTRFYNDPNDDESISNSLVSSLFEDSKGRIWVGGAYEINMYDQKTKGFRSYSFGHLTGDGSSAQPWIVTMSEDKAGRIYFGALDFFDRTIPNSLYFYDELSNSLKRFENPEIGPISNVNDLSTDPSGNMWGIGLNGIFRISLDGSVELIKLPTEFEYIGTLSRRQSIASDQSGRIWITSASTKILVYDPLSGNFEMLDFESILGLNSNDLFINKIHFDENNIAWIATSTGIFQYNTISGDWLDFVHEGSGQYSDLDIITFDIDSFGNLWMGTLQAGLLKYENQRLFNSYRGDRQTANKITNGWVNRIFESADGTVWLSTADLNSDGINQIDFKNDTVTIIDDSFFGADWQFVVEFNEQRPGIFYISDLTNMYSLDVSEMKLSVVDTRPLPEDVGINKYFVDHNGTEWFGTNKGLYEIKTGQSDYIHHDLRTQNWENESSNVITYFVQDSTSGFWILTNDGLFYYSYSSENVNRHAYDPSLGDVFASQDINSLLMDENGIVWVGTWSGGLSRYDTNTKEIETFTMADGLPSMSIQFILKDDDNNDIWLSTFDGISRFDLDTNQFVNYSTENGLHSQLFTDGAGLKTSDGLFIFGGSNGITYFRPSDISRNSLPPNMFFTDFKIDDVSQIFENGTYNTEQINLDHNQNNISIDYTGIHYSNPARNRFSYILENYDSDWRDVSLQRTAYYPNLPPGNYVFRVIAANSNGVWNEEGIAMNIVISPPWWKTIWAYLFYGLLFIGAVYGIDRIQRQRLVRREQERAREKELAQAKEIEKAYQNLEVAHENLKSAQNQLVQQEKLASLGQLTAGIAHEIKNPLNFVNNFSEVSIEMVDEALHEARLVGDNAHAVETISILNDIKTNLTKIHEHGSRADGIVKSMLMHSRGSSDTKEPTDLNGLVREYVNLSYHGMRAGKHPIEVDIELKLDESVGDVPLIAQDFSRVILNLCNNAFDAMGERGDSSKPKLTVRTLRDAQKIMIEIEDNGPGIPDDIQDKILQPFFTTKKGTQGTGLGLSITHDIIKAHGGSMDINSKSGQTIFTIILTH